MPKCKNCGVQLSRLDKEICPFCGEKNPFENVDTSTIDVTKAFDLNQLNTTGCKRKRKIVAFLLAIFLGFVGANTFYIGKWKKGVLSLAISIFSIGGVGSLLFFTNIIHNAFAFIIPYFFLEIFYIVIGIKYLFSQDLKDGRGEFLE